MPDSIEKLVGVGPRTAELLKTLNIHRFQDLLFHLPIRYQDRTRITPIKDLSPGNGVQIQGKILTTNMNYARRRSLIVKLTDSSGDIYLRFFNFTKHQKQRLTADAVLRCFGTVTKIGNRLEMIHPEYCVVNEHDEVEMTPVEQALTPVYSTTKGLKQKKIRTLVRQVLDLVIHDRTIVPDLIPGTINAKVQIPDLISALQSLHLPDPATDFLELEQWRHPAQKRLIFEELLAYHLRLKLIRQNRLKYRAYQIDIKSRTSSEFLSHLPFQLTQAQSKVINEICADLQNKTPMNRLLQGDVGSGKTIVAILTVLHVVQSGYQAAVLAPTEILAEQHAGNFKNRLDAYGVCTAFLVASQTVREKREILDGLASGRIQVVIGTHAVFQTQVKFNKLALCVVDEQHRFGVSQRFVLKQKGQIKEWMPHQFVMTATPIPRTMSMLVYADLDVSILNELPPGRRNVDTISIPDTRRQELIQRVNRVCGNGRQVFWVCPFIDESENSIGQAAVKTFVELQSALPDKCIGLVHGKMKAEQKHAVMQAFVRGELDILVATTVIEVGVDVANASLMIIENAERMGLAQLHQLRGRVGRSDIRSYCILLYHAPLQDNARRRLSIIRGTNNGFEIAQMDLQSRGPGEFLGTRQAGALNFKIADTQRDHGLLPQVLEMATLILDRYPQQVPPLIQRWMQETHDYSMV